MDKSDFCKIDFKIKNTFIFANMNFTKLQLLFICSLICFSCKKANQKRVAVTNNHPIGKESQSQSYDFSNPKKISVNAMLREISGLSFANGNIYTHNDENGIVFKINPKNGKIISEEKFGKDADYEGVEIFNNTVILVQSNGKLSFYNQTDNKTTTVKTPLKLHNDVEGLCVNLQNKNELLIACKGQMLKDDHKNKIKAIYKYDLDTQQLDVNPFIVISDDELTEFAENLLKNQDLSKKKRKKLLNRVVEFAPSGIAMHPMTKNFYIVSARGNLLIILNANKQLQNIIFLNEKQLPQPEGVCFDNDNNLYISTETKGDEGRIYIYKPIL